MDKHQGKDRHLQLDEGTKGQVSGAASLNSLHTDYTLWHCRWI